MADPTFEWVDTDLIRPNRWNPNAMSDEMFVKAIESIHEFGFVDPITVRVEIDTKDDSHFYECIDGEHRWKAAKGHGACVRASVGPGWERHGGLRQLPVTNLGVVTDEIAMQLTIVLNETRGEYDPKRMGSLLTDLVAMKPLPDLLEVLPFDKPKFEELAALPSVDWNDVKFKAKVKGPERGERWVERVYRLPSEAAETLDRAIEQVRENDGSNDWQAIRTIAEHFLRS